MISRLCKHDIRTTAFSNLFAELNRMVSIQVLDSFSGKKDDNRTKQIHEYVVELHDEINRRWCDLGGK